MPNLAELMEAIPDRFDPEVAAGLLAVIQFEFSPEETGGFYFITIEDDRCTVERGVHMSPNMTLKIAAADYIELATGRLTHQLAFMTDRLRVNGDLSLATRLRELLALG